MLQTAKVGQSVSALVTYNAHVTVDVFPERFARARAHQGLKRIPQVMIGDLSTLKGPAMHVCCDAIVHVFAVGNDTSGLREQNGAKRLVCVCVCVCVLSASPSMCPRTSAPHHSIPAPTPPLLGLP